MFGTVAITLYIAHMVADHWGQHDKQAANKGAEGRIGQLHCAIHVAIHTAILAAALGFVWWDQALPINPLAFVAGLALNGATHYFADRRKPLRKLAEKTGQGKFYQLNAGGISGPYLLDQAWHIGWLLPVGAIIA